ncbi:hypothetical protein TNIN_122621 [Trichonephila inaurata madagascariensis]|uniref:Uncharacterized protein n=1 Tax=Trichonephila inaurata madagascariensis TaxID=2747483 RepID=A0A8X7BUB4_9ARAC|nr:hypothetical protein TNIN_122621 [Trichonephila inaurata madagascariensis]
MDQSQLEPYRNNRCPHVSFVFRHHLHYGGMFSKDQLLQLPLSQSPSRYYNMRVILDLTLAPPTGIVYTVIFQN